MIPARAEKRLDSRLRGVTLTEVVVASTLLVVALVPILKALTLAQATGIVIERRTQSLVLAQGKLDEIRARSVYNYSTSYAQNPVSLGNSDLCTVSDNGDPSLKTISVSVGFDANTDGRLDPDEVMATLTTYVAKRWP
jgi:Tfp pilus assembly protein PilV